MIQTFIILSIAVKFSSSQLIPPDEHFQSIDCDNIAEEQQFQESFIGSGIHKHIFAYVAPDDTSDQIIRVPGGPSGGTHFKILFIKAPGALAPRIEVPSLGGPDIRTLVYVLQPRTRQPQIDGPISVGPTPKPQPPKVFFIRYNPRGDA